MSKISGRYLNKLPAPAKTVLLMNKFLKNSPRLCIDKISQNMNKLTKYKK